MYFAPHSQSFQWISGRCQSPPSRMPRQWPGRSNRHLQESQLEECWRRPPHPPPRLSWLPPLPMSLQDCTSYSRQCTFSNNICLILSMYFSLRVCNIYSHIFQSVFARHLASNIFFWKFTNIATVFVFFLLSFVFVLWSWVDMRGRHGEQEQPLLRI